MLNYKPIYMSVHKKHSFLYDLLISPKLRVWRHIIFILSITIIVFNQALIMYQQNGGSLDYNVLWMGLGLLTAYLLISYFNIFVLVPRYLLQKKYISYLIALSISILLLQATRMIEEYTIYKVLNISSERASYFNIVTLFDYISYFVLNIICIAGVSMTILLKEWITENKRISDLENKHIQSEVEQLKDQVNPLFLFNILNKTGVLAKEQPERASQMVLKLSQLIRYQLYDSSREKVLVSSEINFLTNYLALEKLYSGTLEYSITTSGDLNRVFVPPLLFISIAQYAVNQTYQHDSNPTVIFHFDSSDNKLYFTCKCMISKDFDFSRIEQRLKMLYKQNYSLSVIPGKDKQESIINLQLSIIEP